MANVIPPKPFEFITNKEGHTVLITLLVVPVTGVFSTIDKPQKNEIKGYDFKDRAFESEDDKAVDQHLKRGGTTKLLQPS